MPTDALDRERTVRLVFEVSPTASPLGTVAAAIEGALTVERVVSVNEHRWLAYGKTTGAPSAVASVASEEDRIADARVITERAEDCRVELRLVAPPLLSAVQEAGGDLERFRIAADGGILEVAVGTEADADSVVEALSGLAGVTLRSEETAAVDAETDPLAALTDRQRDVLVTAYSAGFFDWPRASDGEEVADSLGIAQPTFVEHLRRAEQTVLAALLDDQ